MRSWARRRPDCVHSSLRHVIRSYVPGRDKIKHCSSNTCKTRTYPPAQGENLLLDNPAVFTLSLCCCWTARHTCCFPEATIRYSRLLHLQTSYTQHIYKDVYTRRDPEADQLVKVNGARGVQPNAKRETLIRRSVCLGQARPGRIA